MSGELRLNQMNKSEIKENKYNSTGRILFLNLNIFKLLLIFISILQLSNEIDITLKVNGIGNQQILSDAYNIGQYPPFRIILINTDQQVQILRDKMVYVNSLSDKIQFQWKKTYHNFSYMFANVSSIISVTLNNINSANSNLSHMFYNCTNLQNFSVSNFNPSYKVKDVSYMFYNCYSLKNFFFYQFKFYNSMDLSYIFYNCSSLTNFTDLNDIIANDMKYSFYNCSSLTSINFTKISFSTCISMTHAFYNCHNLNTTSHNAM